MFQGMLFGDKAAWKMGSISNLSPVQEILDLSVFFGAVESSLAEMDFAMGGVWCFIFYFW